MKSYKLINNITGWFAFLVALVTYLLTIEPTASFWDCGEFISCGYKLDVGHPPGAPFFMLTGRFFSLFASDPTTVAQMLNAMSAIFSALTILLLFWTITHLARKIIVKDENNISVSQIIAIMGAGLVGALAYTFSDTFWFSAVEGEVYAYSSLFTAVVFWAILKWEDVADEPHADRWLIFIAYLMGLSIGVHLLNLLAIPAIVLVYYYKKYNPSFKGMFIALMTSFAILLLIMYGFIQGSVEVASWFELFFVNILGFSYNAGAVVYVMFVVAFLAWSTYESYTGKSEIRMKLSFFLSILILGIPFIGDGILVPAVLIIGLLIWLFAAKISAKLINTITLSLIVLFIGYSTYAITVIRSLANPPMDQNAPDNMFALQSYLNREQYGETPLFYGQYYTADYEYVAKDGYCMPATTEGRKLWIKDTIEGGKARYITDGRKTSNIYASEFKTIFPRMYSSSPNHVEGYKMWGQVEGRTVRYSACGRDRTGMVPTFGENLRYFFKYQVNFMYWRYFMWNFSGRQNDIQGHGEVQNGNWITGFNFIDQYLVGDQSNLPPDMENNKGRNRLYMLPLLLGLIGIVYQLMSGPKGVEKFWIILLLFFMTGLAIVLYLNQPPYQPRERDYAYAGSFYAFAIWIGFGVLGIAKMLKRFLPAAPSAIIASVLCMGVPVLMASENWDDHDRSARYTCADFGYNYLMSCEENAVIFTYGDNDTFPLWYMQEVEGVRTDVRVCNLSYLQTDWYIDQMRRGYYDSKALPISLKQNQYGGSTRIYAPVNSESYPIVPSLRDKETELGLALAFYGSNDKYKTTSGENFMPSQNLFLNVDSAQVVKTGTVAPEEADKIVSKLPIRLRNHIMKNEYAILDILNNNNWERPIYYAITVGNEANLGLRKYSRNEGLARRIIPIEQISENAINTEKMYNNLMNVFRWGGVENPKIYLDGTSMSMYKTARGLFGTLASQLINEGQNEKAIEVLDRCFKVIPLYNVPSDYSILSFIDMYYMLGENEKAENLAMELLDKTDKNLMWFFNLDRNKMSSALYDINENIRNYRTILSFFERYDKENYDKYSGQFNSYFETYNKLLR